MFLGAIPRRPEKAVAYKQLQKHLTILGIWVAAIRVAPYVAHFLSKDGDQELKLEL
eukprot:Gb_39015 [translate_table: standard]